MFFFPEVFYVFPTETYRSNTPMIETVHIKPPDHRLSGRRRSAVLLERSARGKGPVQRAALRDPGHLARNQGGVEMLGDIQLLAKQNLVDLINHSHTNGLNIQ